MSITPNPKQLSPKYILVTLIVTTIGFILLAFLLNGFLNEQAEASSKKELINVFSAIDGIIKENNIITVYPSTKGTTTPKDSANDNASEKKEDTPTFSIKEKELKSYIDAIIKTDPSKTIIFSGPNNDIHLAYGYKSDEIILGKLPKTFKISQDPTFMGLVNIDEKYKEDFYVYSTPIIDENKQIFSYLIILSNTADHKDFVKSFFQLYIIAFIAIIAFIFTTMTVTLDKFMIPLAEMALVTKSFAKGDFSQRVPIYGNGTDELSHLSIAFNNMASSLESHEQTRKSFVANVSHELRTPMTTISGFIDGILDGTIPVERRNEYLIVVSNETKRLARLVVSMLNISKIEAGELQIAPKVFDLNELVMQIVFSFEKKINDKKLEVVGLDVRPQKVYADSDMIHQAIYNLVENAIKFANESGFLEFRYYKEKEKVFIGIKNSGEGLSDKQIAQIFDRFYKVDHSRGLNKEGSGLGLFIVRSIINLHGGDVIVNSVENEYTEFVFSLPDEDSYTLDD